MPESVLSHKLEAMTADAKALIESEEFFNRTKKLHRNREDNQFYRLWRESFAKDFFVAAGDIRPAASWEYAIPLKDLSRKTNEVDGKSLVEMRVDAGIVMDEIDGNRVDAELSDGGIVKAVNVFPDRFLSINFAEEEGNLYPVLVVKKDYLAEDGEFGVREKRKAAKIVSIVKEMLGMEEPEKSGTEKITCGNCGNSYFVEAAHGNITNCPSCGASN